MFRIAAARSAKAVFRQAPRGPAQPALRSLRTQPDTTHPSTPPLSGLDAEVEGVAPEVSSYAIGATVVLIGGVAYYAYSEFGAGIAKHLPWLGSGAASTGAQSTAEAKAEAKSQAQRVRRLRARMAPVSTMPALEQVNWAWTHPGLYVTGSNKYGLVDPLHPGSGVGLKAAVPGLGGKLLRSAAFATTHAAAVDADGCLYQWGTGFAGAAVPHTPLCTLRDSSIRLLVASNDYVAVLDSKSRVRLVPATASASAEPATLAFEPRLGWRENVVSLSAGEDHIAATTSSGHVYTCALGPRGNDRSQLGLGAAAAATVQPFVLKRVPADRKFSAAVCGGRHTLLLTVDGDVLGCGANDFGQLAMGNYTEGNSTVRELTPLRRLWKDEHFRPALERAEMLAASSATSYIQVRRGDNLRLLSCGRGIDGQLGTGFLVHMQGKPAVISALSDKHEFDPQSQLRKPLGLRSISAAGDHVVAVRDNHTNVVLDQSGAEVNKAPLFGYDVLIWGSNKEGQCIPDRRHRFAEPSHPSPLYRTSNPASASTSTLTGADDVSAPRLQAAPRQWVPEAAFKNLNSESSSNKTTRSSAKHLVEQAFVAGPEITAAYLKLC
ncbi:hypothetical protein GGF37_005297 [Kickxella alabastrina]|nr:hypothetical protein GGF37_005297 [Kickxella alabastrina]